MSNNTSEISITIENNNKIGKKYDLSRITKKINTLLLNGAKLSEKTNIIQIKTDLDTLSNNYINALNHHINIHNEWFDDKFQQDVNVFTENMNNYELNQKTYLDNDNIKFII